MSKICIVTDEMVSVCGVGGIGACSLGLATHFARVGHEVDVLITNPDYRTISRIDPAPPFRIFSLTEWSDQDATVLKPFDAISSAYAVYRFLRERAYRCVHFNDWRGSGFYVAMARRQGSFDATVVTHLHGSSEWTRSYNLHPPTLDDLQREGIERSQIENSDMVVAPSRYLVEWYRAKGIVMRHAEVLNWILPQWLDAGGMAKEALTTRSVEAGQVDELIFFGRHERRKGFEIFIGALQRLPPDLQPDVIFIGRFDRLNREHTGSYALGLLAKYKGRLRFFNDLGQKEAFDFIRNSRNALCVMPSLVENSPCVVGECFSAGIPFLSTKVGGIAELMTPASQAHALSQPNARDLAALMERVLRQGMPPLTSTLVPAAIGERWTAMGQVLDRPVPRVLPSDPEPLVSVCVTHYERPAMLRRALQAIDRQDYGPLEIVVVDDGSPSPITQRELDRIEAETWTHPLRIVRTGNRYLGAARNRAASEAKGEYLLFHDDDNVAEPHEIRSFVEAARISGADILTSVYYVFREPEHGSASQPRRIEYFPIGIGGTFSFFKNGFGDANALVRRSTFEAIGGFSEHHGVGWEDWEFFLRGYLQNFRLGVVPEPLFNYRISNDGMLSTGDPVKNAERLFEAVEALKPNVGSEVFRLAQREPLLQQILDTTWNRLGLRDHGVLHRDLMALEPNSDEAKAKLCDLAFALGRVEDAIQLGLHSFSQRERLFHLVKLMQPARGQRADLSVVKIVQPSGAADHLLVKGWQAGPESSSGLLGLRIGRRSFDIVTCWREARADVQAHLGLERDGGLGFTLLARERPASRKTASSRGRSWIKAGTTLGLDIGEVRVEVDAPGCIAHVDSVTWCHSAAMPLDDEAVVFIDVETSEPADAYLVTADGRAVTGQPVHHLRSRFHVPPSGGPMAPATIVVPNRVRADVIVGRTITP